MTVASRGFSRLPRLFQVSDEVRVAAQGASRVAPGLSGTHEMARGSSSLLSSHGRVIGPQDGLKKDSRGLSRVTA